MSAQKQKNTLFSYFSKSPKTPSSEARTGGSAAATPPPARAERAGQATQATPKLKVKQGFVQTPFPVDKDPKFANGDLVWAKLEGYPWWVSHRLFSSTGSSEGVEPALPSCLVVVGGLHWCACTRRSK